MTSTSDAPASEPGDRPSADGACLAPPPALPLRRVGACLAAGVLVAVAASAVDAVVAPGPGEPLALRWLRTAAHQQGRLLLGTALLLLSVLPSPPAGQGPDAARKPGPEGLQ